MSEANKALVARFYDSFNTNDAEGFRAILRSDWVDHPSAPGQSPGPEGLLEVVEAFRTSFQGLFITAEQVVAEGDFVTVRIRLAGKHVADWLEYPATQRDVVFSGMDMHHIQDGRILETWHFENFSVLAAS